MVSSPEQTSLDVEAIRRDFPLLQRRVNGRPLVYLDSAATSLKPTPVIEAITEFYRDYTANVGRGVHCLAEEATQRFEESRETIASFINAEAREIAFTRNTTDAINLVAHNLPPDARVLSAATEHHSNLLPWREKGDVVLLRTDEVGRTELDDLERHLASGAFDLLAVSDVSNAFGTIQPIAAMIEMCHLRGVRVLVDGSQSVPHQPTDVKSLGCDYLCFSGHKMCGPSGIGVLYARWDCMKAIRPLNLGGGMVESVDTHDCVLHDAPYRLEAGTPFIEGAIGLAAACDYLERVGMESIDQHVAVLLEYLQAKLITIQRLKILGPLNKASRSGSVTWTMDGSDSHTIARVLSDRHNVCVRSGFHCAELAHKTLGVAPSVRASIYLYNSMDEVDQLVQALQTIGKQLHR